MSSSTVEKTSASIDDLNGWKDYMGTKISKLGKQFSDTGSGNHPKSQLFSGISIFVNGYTNPSASELKRIMQSHGGVYHSYKLSTTKYTIASNLAYSKLQAFRSKGEIVVKPEWITECLKQQRIVDVGDYCLSGKEAGTSAPKRIAPARKLSGTDEDISVPGCSKSKSPKITEVGHAEDTPDPVITNQPQASNIDHHAENTERSVPKTGDASFVAEFYAHSRLHFISTLAQEMKDYFRKLRQNMNDSTFSGRTKLGALISSSETRSSDIFVPSGSFFMHVDMDCFFASVGIKNRPHLVDKPIAVCHSRGQRTTHKDGSDFSSYAEIASCNYVARQFGVGNGMFLGEAKRLCPELTPIPYDFEDYRSISQTLYTTVLEYTDLIEPVSCDEMYADVGDVCREVGVSPAEFAEHLRTTILLRTGCNASTGLGPSMLAARIATKKAKPNGLFVMKPQDVEEYFLELKLADIPGVGYAMLQKFSDLGVETCQDLLNQPKSKISQLLGAKTADKVLSACRGVDNRLIDSSYGGRKSISCTVNYGIRLTEFSEAKTFLTGLTDELAKRMNSAEVAGKQITLQLLIRAPDAPIETKKFLGCGMCDAVSKSKNFDRLIFEKGDILKNVVSIWEEISPVLTDVRGIGIAMHKLVPKVELQTSSRPTMESFFKPNRNSERPKSASIFFEDYSSAASTCDSADDSFTIKLPRQMDMKDSADAGVRECVEVISEMATVEKVCELDLTILQEHVLKLVNDWYPDLAEKLLNSFESFCKSACDPLWKDYAENLRQSYQACFNELLGTNSV